MMSKLFGFLSISFFFLIVVSSSSLLNAQKFKFKEYNVDDGIPQPYVYTINQDDNGYLWIGTGGGLCKFDGISFYSFDKSDSLVEDFVTASCLDINKKMWYAHNQGGISYFNNKIFQKFDTDSLLNSTINDIIPDSDGNLWFISQNDGILMVNTKNTLSHFKQGLENMIVYTACFTDFNRILIGTSDGLFITEINDKKTGFNELVQIEEIPPTKIQCIYKRKNGDSYLIGTEDEGLFELFDKSSSENSFIVTDITIKDCLDSENVQDIMEDKDTNILVATFGKGLIKLKQSEQNKSYNLIANYTEANGLSSNYIKKIFEDSEGYIWLGTYGYGLIFLANDFFSFYTIWGKNSVHSIYHDNENEWYGTDSGLVRINLVENRNRTFYPVSNIVDKVNITTIHKIDGEILWIGTDNYGVYKMNIPDNSFSKLDIFNTKLENKINSIYAIKDKLWIATVGGVYEYNLTTKESNHYTIRDGLPHNNVRSVYSDRDNKIWLISYGKDICTIENGRINKHKISKGSDILEPSSITQDVNGDIWLATYGNGIFKYDAEESMNINTNQGLLSDYCYSIIADDFGYIWVGHSLGLSKINIKDLSVKIYSKDFGIKDECQYNSCFKDMSGNIWFGTTAGTIKYDPSKNIKDTFAPKLNFTSLKLSDKEIDFTTDINYPYGKYKLRVEFIGINFNDPERVEYQYKLEGYDLDWSDVTLDNFAQYGRIEDGNYSFLVRACNSEAVCNEKPLQLNIRIDSPIWKKWWFITLIIIIVFSSFIIYYRSRIQKIKKQQRILEGLVRERTAEIEEKNTKLKELSIVASETDNAISIYGPDGIVEYRNRAFTKLYKDLLNETIFGVGENINSLGDDKILERFKTCYSSGKTVTYVMANQVSSGEKYWIQTTLSPVLDNIGNVLKIVSIDTDISDIKRAEETIVKQSQELEKLSIVARETDNSVIIMDNTGKFEWVNAGFEKLFGYTLEEFKLKYSDNIIDSSSNKEIGDLVRNCIKTGEAVTYDSVFQKPDGQIWLQSTMTPIMDKDGKISKIVTIDSDITKLKDFQDQLVASEKKAAMVQLIAGIAHEINTPLGAISSSISNVSKVVQSSFSTFPSFFNNLNSNERNEFISIFILSLKQVQNSSSKDERRARKAIMSSLESRNIDNSYEIADYLVDMGIFEVTADIEGILKCDNPIHLVEMAYKLSSLQRSTQTIEIAAKRASKIVFALKTYAKFDQANEKIEVNLAEGIEAVLTIYHNLLEQGIEIVRDWSNEKNISCIPLDLNQVWTNLIHNAIQAMGGNGRLSISVAEHDNGQLVSINDTGHGIPDDIKDSVFKEFFTTRPSGEGSGLGLDTTRKIIEKHNGKIWFESETGNTSFFVWLPY